MFEPEEKDNISRLDEYKALADAHYAAERYHESLKCYREMKSLAKPLSHDFLVYQATGDLGAAQCCEKLGAWYDALGFYLDTVEVQTKQYNLQRTFFYSVLKETLGCFAKTISTLKFGFPQRLTSKLHQFNQLQMSEAEVMDGGVQQVKLMGLLQELDEYSRKLYLKIFSTKVTTAHITNLPRCNPYYQARKTQSALIVESLKKAPVNKNTQSLVLAGGIGTGKTQLVLDYAYAHLEDYLFIRFMTAERLPVDKDSAQKSPFESEYRYLAIALDIVDFDTKPIALLQTEIHDRLHFYATKKDAFKNKKLLFIFDNVNDKDALEPFLKSVQLDTPALKVDILITTRDSTWPNAIQIGAYEEQDALNYVSRITELTPSLHQKTSSSVSSEQQLIETKFANSLECNPLILTHALAYCVKQRISLNHFLEKFECNFQEVIIGQEEIDPERPLAYSFFDEKLLGYYEKYPQTIYLAFKSQLDVFLEKCESLEEEVKEQAQLTLGTVGMLSYYSSDSISKQFVKALVKTQLLRKDAPISEEILEHNTGLILRNLERFGLLAPEQNALPAPHEHPINYSRHTLTQEAVRLYWKHESLQPNKKCYLVAPETLLEMLATTSETFASPSGFSQAKAVGVLGLLQNTSSPEDLPEDSIKNDSNLN